MVLGSHLYGRVEIRARRTGRILLRVVRASHVLATGSHVKHGNFKIFAKV